MGDAIEDSLVGPDDNLLTPTSYYTDTFSPPPSGLTAGSRSESTAAPSQSWTDVLKGVVGSIVSGGGLRAPAPRRVVPPPSQTSPLVWVVGLGVVGVGAYFLLRRKPAS